MVLDVDRVNCDDDIPITILNLVLSYVLNFSTAVESVRCMFGALGVAMMQHLMPTTDMRY